MTDKILFLLNRDIIYLGFAKYLQEKHEVQQYAIIEVNKGKKFFENQKIVNFEKIWFYHDSIKNIKKIDMDYLVNFEKKYKINLWNLIYSDRHFYRYNKYHIFNQNEILSIIECLCKFFERILNEVSPNFIVMSTVDRHIELLLHEMCKNKGIKIMIVGPTRFGYRAMISQDEDKIDNIHEEDKIDHGHEEKIESNLTSSQLKEYVKKYYSQHNQVLKNVRTSNSAKVKASFQDLFIRGDDYKKYYRNFGRTRRKILFKNINFVLKRKLRKNFLDKKSLRKIHLKEKFVYFPLHYQPERSTMIAAPFVEQFEIIENISRSLPVDYKLYVKEHPLMQINGWRDIDYYKKILNLPNVELIHPNVENEILLNGCSLVATITGTSGLEAAFYGKPSIVFADVIFSSLSSVIKIKNREELPQKIRIALDKKPDVNELNRYIQTIEKVSFNFDLSGLRNDMNTRFYYGGHLADVKISEEKVKEFLDDNKEEFNKVADEFVKKIKYYKKIN